MTYGGFHRSQPHHGFRCGWAMAGDVGFVLATKEKLQFGQWVDVRGLLCFWLNIGFLFSSFWLNLVGVIVGVWLITTTTFGYSEPSMVSIELGLLKKKKKGEFGL